MSYLESQVRKARDKDTAKKKASNKKAMKTVVETGAAQPRADTKKGKKRKLASIANGQVLVNATMF